MCGKTNAVTWEGLSRMRIVLTKKLRGHSVKSRSSCKVSGGGVGAEGIVTKGKNWRGF